MPDHNLIVLSDVHLGCDLVQHARPGAPTRTRASVKRDRELVSLLDYYRARRRSGLPWKLVIAGDFVDFVGMSVSGGAVATSLNADEVRHGLGSAVDHTLAKLKLVAEHHAEVFAALGRFVADGNQLVVVRGNHDVDFHWSDVQAAFRDLLEAHAPGAGVEFADWFYYEEGRVFIEHGHQYDDYCSYDHVLFPVLPSDPRRSLRSLSDVLLRYVVRPTQGMTEGGHDAASALDYLRFGARLGVAGMLALGSRFVAAIAALIALYREHMSEAARWVRGEHERKMALLAEAREISILRLRALASLQRPPVTRSLLKTLASLMVDRVLVSVVAIGFGVWALCARWTPGLGYTLAAGLPALALLGFLWRRARGAIDASESLRERAARVAAVFPAAFIVMGHTHLPEVRRATDAATYVNLGAWAEEDTPDGSPPPLPATRTHLVVLEEGGKTAAQLYSWDTESGPRAFIRPDRS